MKRSMFAGGFVAACAAVAGVTFAARAPGASSASAAAPDTLVAYGARLVMQTYAEIGPEVSDPAKRFAGDNLACQSCHIDGGTNPEVLPLGGVYKAFPKFHERDQRVESVVARINECMTRSMNGRALSEQSREMKAFLAYLGSIAGAPANRAPAAEAPPLPGDPVRGAQVYATACAACHQPDGLGKRRGMAGDARGYEFPPLWGPDSFNAGAGMNESRRFADFVRLAMPRGIDPNRPQLSWQEAWDVAAYVRSQPRPALR
jgi:thiosulfate dehydrogenase